MDVGIKEIGITFLVGSLVLLGIDAISSFVLRRPLTGFFEGRVQPTYAQK